jgi:protocatechuate 3,4-dioxygenase beta subunit
MNDNEIRITRRRSLAAVGGFLGTVLAVGGWKAQASDGAGPAGVASGTVKCVLAPEQTQGPYYIAGAKTRRNITEGRPGTPLTLHTTVVDASTCKPIKGAAVDVWHADASGTYSGVQQAVGQTFMRGIQKTAAGGLALFKTVYPGWYPGRTVHIHVMVHIGGNVVHTGQLYFPDTVTDAAYTKAPYNSRGVRDTRNANDSVYRNGGKNSLVTIHTDGAGSYVASITMGVHR